MSLCSCDYYDGDCTVEFSSSDWIKARKDHRCDACGRVITAGEHYQYESGKCDGDFYTRRACADCRSLEAVFPGCMCGPENEYQNTIRALLMDYTDDVPWDRVPELTPKMRDWFLSTVQEILDREGE